MNYILGEVAQDVFVYYFSRHSLYEVSFLYALDYLDLNVTHVILSDNM